VGDADPGGAEYSGQPREAKGVLRQYLGKMTGLSRAQVTRLIGGTTRVGW